MGVLIIVLTVGLNWQYFRPKTFYAVRDTQKLSGELWDQQRKGAILDYLPKTALEPREAAPTVPLVLRGEATVTDFVNRSGSWKFLVQVTQPAIIEVPVFYFPNWKVKVNGKDYPFSYKNVLGRIAITLNPGSYEVEGYFGNTPLRIAANLISLLSVGTLAVYVYSIYGKKDS
jgi:hypothetical protein